MAIETRRGISETEEVSSDLDMETATIPMSILGEQSAAPGDVVKLQVVSLDEDNGNYVVKYATEEKPGGAIDAMSESYTAV